MLKLWKAGPLQKWLMNLLPTTASPTYTCTTRELDVTPAVLIALSSKNVSRLLRAKSRNGASGKRCDIDLSCRPRRGSAEPNQAAIGRRSEGRVSGQRTSQSLTIHVLCYSERKCRCGLDRGMERLGKPRHRQAGRRPSERAANEPISHYYYKDE